MHAEPVVSIILPTYNERECLPTVVREIHDVLGPLRHEIIVVDDNSPDRTWEWVESEAQRNPFLRLIRRMKNPGLSAAVLEGFAAARADRWIVMDADGQHDPGILSTMYRALDARELVVSSRYVQRGGTGRWSLSRWWGSRIATWLAQLILNVRLSDPMSGYFGIRREAFTRVQATMNPKGFKILLELCYRLGKHQPRPEEVCVEVPYRFRGRLAGESKLTSRIVSQYLRMLLTLRKEEPLPQGLPKFLAVGALGAVVNCAVLWGLVAYAQWHYLLASAVAIEVSMAHNFIWHDRWTFKDRRGHRRWPTRLAHFQVTTLAGLVINWLLLVALVAWAQWSLLAANLVGIGASTLLNFVMSKLWAWKPASCAVTT